MLRPEGSGQMQIRAAGQGVKGMCQIGANRCRMSEKR